MLAAAALLGSLAMLAFMARSLVTGRIPFTGDLLHFHYPLRDFYARQLAAGQPFDWMPGLFGGFYVVGEGQLGGYHPLHWLLYLTLPLDRAFAIELVVAYPFLFAGMWQWLRRRCGAPAAAFGAMAATFCGFTLVHAAHPNMVGVLAHLPWMLWVLDGVAARHGRFLDPRAAALFGLLLGSQLLLGHPQAVWFTGLVVAAYAAHLMVSTASMRTTVGVTLLAGAVLGLAVGAVQVLATLDAVAHSTRQDTADFATQYSLQPLYLLQLLHPYLFWGRMARWNETAPAPDEYGVYGGGVALVLAVWWMARQWTVRPRDRFSLRVLGLAVMALWLATGSYGKLYYLQTWLPVVSQFRAPLRYVVIAQWAFAVLGALAIARLLQRERADERMPLSMAWTLVVLAAATAPWLPMPGNDLMVRWAGPLVLALSALLLTTAAYGQRAALAALVVLAACDQALYGLNGVITWQDFVTRQQAIAFLDTNSFLPRAGENRLMRGNYPNLYLLANHRLLDGYVAITPAKELDYHQPNALRVAQVEYAHADFFKGLPVPEGAEPRDRGWFRLPGALPRARLVAAAHVSTSPAGDITQLDVSQAALVTRQLHLGGTAAGQVRIREDVPGAITLDVDAPAPQLLVVSESFHDGWRATIDTRPVPVERVNGDFIGAVAPAGSHVVRLQFLPAHLTAGRYMSLLAVAIALAVIFWRDRRPMTDD
jgi:hypothetical protein